MKKLWLLGFVSFFIAPQIFATASVVISEIAWSGTSASPYDEWIELYNAGDETIDLSGWTITANSKKFNISLTGTISAPKDLASPKRFFLLERTDNTSTSATADQIYTGGLHNDGIQLFLKNQAGEIIDQTPAGQWVAGTNKPKRSMERINFLVSGLNKDNWGTALQTSNITDAKQNPINGSPKEPNSLTPKKLFQPKPEKFSQQPFTATFKHIAPSTYNDQPEWFSVQIESEGAVDLSDWSISNGKTTKKLSKLFSQIQYLEDEFTTNLAGTTHKNIIYPTNRLFLLPKWNPKTKKHTGIFYFQKSPVSLPDKGGTIILKNKTKILDEIQFPKSTKKTIQKQKFREIFVFKNKRYTPLIAHPTKYRAEDILQSQTLSPTNPSKYKLVVSEIAPTRINEPDFIEILVQQAPEEGANIKYTAIKQNGSVLKFFPEDYLVHKGDFILIYFDRQNTALKKDNKHIFSAAKRSGLSRTSGTIEIVHAANTSQQELLQFFCWYRKELNKTESKRKQTLSPNTVCWKHEFLPQESFARDESNNQFFSHPHGTPGQLNYLENIRNFRPRSVITKQSTTAHTINVTGDDSFDPNGDWDLIKFRWTWQLISPNQTQTIHTNSKKNPKSLRLEAHKKLSPEMCTQSHYEITLSVTDQLGLSNQARTTFPLLWKNKHCQIKTQTTDRTPKKRKKWKKPTVSAATIWTETDFFADFKKFGHRPKIITPPLPPFPKFNSKAEELMTQYHLGPNQIRKNIGLYFDPK
ncbi:hypothetical protein CSB37_01805 [bacterium DOLZORAL124_38_8]|nr:MAG: hypothetical protein CSB37_01805 [bacterium DOLZORAL124_38_8]